MGKPRTPQGDKPKSVSAKAREALRSLPSVASLLEHEEVQDWLAGLPRASVVAAIQKAVDSARVRIRGGDMTGRIDVQDLLASAEEELMQRSTPSLRPVINATGIVLHTGLGRAPLSDAAVEAVAEGAAGYCSLEYELESGRRGRRVDHVVELITSLTGAESATVVNNNAAATLLILRTFAECREVIVSRGQMIEIGGSFRLPDIMAASGARLREVGTTNRTRIEDYRLAIGIDTAMLLRAHPSNYRVVGFTEEVGMDEIADLAHERRLLAVDDIGSGALFDLTPYGLPDEPSVRGSLSAGADLVCFSGDKLLGGPQCGLIVGRQALISALDASPLMRTYRVDKLTLLALDATLRCYLDPAHAMEHVPTLAMLRTSADELAQRAGKLADQLQAALPDERFFVCSDVGFAGGGSMPGREMQTVVVQWRPSHTSTDQMAAALRDSDTPVITRVRDDAICFDLRTIRDAEFDGLVAAVSAAVWDEATEDVEDEEPTS